MARCATCRLHWIMLQGVPENSLHFLKTLSFFNYSSFRVSTILILKLTAPALKWLLTLCTHISRSQVAIKSVLTMKIQNAQKLTIFEKMQKQSCIGFFQTPHSCLLLLLRMIKKFNYQTFYVNSNFSLWLEILKIGSVTFLEESSHLNGDFFSV